MQHSPNTPVVGATAAAFVSKTDYAIAQLKTELTNLQRRYGDLHKRTECERRTRENEMKQKFQAKFESLREKLQHEKQREIDNLLANVKRDYEQRLTTAMQIKERDAMRQSRQQTACGKTQQKPIEQKQLCQDGSTLKNRDATACIVTQKINAVDKYGDIRERLTIAQDQLCQSEKLLKEKDEEIVSLKNAKNATAHGMTVESQKHIRSLLEEVRQKERQINKLEHSLKSVEHQLVRATSGCNNFLSPSLHAGDGAVDAMLLSGKMAPALSASKSVTGASFSGMARDEYDREKQRWSTKLSDLEAQLKFSEQSNADLSQSKADLIRRVKELEKTQKMLQESFKKLTEKHKTMCQDTKQADEKFRQCYEENINLKQNLERVTMECNKIKEKRARCDKQEEVEKLKQQSLEYCKTISALKQTNIEKDRRLDMLHQKFKRVKQRSRSKTVDFLFTDEETKSWAGSDHSVSSASLNTIVEDWAELPREELETNYRQLARNFLELQRVHLSLSRCHVEQQQHNQQVSAYGSVDASSSSSSSPSDLAGKYREAVKKIENLQKFISTTNALGADADWAQEKMKCATTIENLQTKIDDLNASHEKLQCEVQELKDQNELLEFQVLECQQYSSEGGSPSSLKSRRVCDRSISTSEDEGVYSVDSFDDAADNIDHKAFSLEDLKMRFTLLKHRKELRAEDRAVIAQVKNVWETLHQKHSQCNANEMEWQMKFREIESCWKEESDSLKQQLEELCIKKKKRLKFKEIQNELENACKTSAGLQNINAELEKRLAECETELEKVKYLLKISDESKQREQKHSEELRRQVDNLKQGRVAEMELLEGATNHKTKELDAYRRKEDELEAEIKELTLTNENLRKDFDTNFERLLNEERSKHHAQLDEQKCVEIKLKQQLQCVQDSCHTMEQKFQDSLKNVRRLEKQELKTSNEMNDLLLVNDRLTKTVEQMHENRIELNQRCIELETSWQNAKQELDDERRRLVDDHSKQLMDANSNLERIRLNFEEKSSENTKLQKQLNQLKSYSKQLEAQFEIQLQTVQILKDQLIHIQKNSLQKDSQLKEMEKFYQNHNNDSSNECRNFEKQSSSDDVSCSKLKSLLKLMPNATTVGVSSTSIGSSNELRKICINLDSFLCQSANDTDDWSTSLKMLCQNFRNLIKTADDLQNRLEEYRLETEIARGEADKANDRADKLCKQYRDMIIQLTNFNGKDSCARCSSVQFLDALNTELKTKLDIEKCLYKSEPTALNNNRRSVEYLIVQLKNICTKNCTDVEIMHHVQSILCTMLSDDDGAQRTISPLEFSGTESEIYGGDKSPILEPCSVSSSSACSNTDQLSPANRFVDHHSSSYEEDSISDSGLFTSNVSKQKRKTIKTLRRTHSVIFDDRNHVIEPPTFVKLETDCKDGRYKICWGSPATVLGAGGYKIYINGNVCKTISNILCTKTVVSCLSKIDLETLSITTFSRKFRCNESCHVNIGNLH